MARPKQGVSFSCYHQGRSKGPSRAVNAKMTRNRVVFGDFCQKVPKQAAASDKSLNGTNKNRGRNRKRCSQRSQLGGRWQPEGCPCPGGTASQGHVFWELGPLGPGRSVCAPGEAKGEPGGTSLSLFPAGPHRPLMSPFLVNSPGPEAPPERGAAKRRRE